MFMSCVLGMTCCYAGKCLNPTVSFRRLQDVNHPGNNIDSYEDISVDECAQKCAKKKKCVMFNYRYKERKCECTIACIGGLRFAGHTAPNYCGDGPK